MPVDSADFWLPLVFIWLTGFAMLLYALLDGYDLGVGMLMLGANDSQRDRMIASIGPFWDANETWLVLGVGLLLVAFPKAHGVILGGLYLPVAAMLVGLILRGVSFDFRAKAHVSHKALWDFLFFAGSLLASLSQGYMLGRYIMGLDNSLGAQLFACVSAVCVAFAYSLLGAGWLIMKTTDALHRKAIRWARWALVLTALGLVCVSIVNPLVSDRIFAKWFSLPNVFVLTPIPIACGYLLWRIYRELDRLSSTDDNRHYKPFVFTLGVFVLSFAGLAYSFYPFVVPDQLTVWQAASSSEALWVIFWGAIVVLPTILAYSAWSYWVFRGKAEALEYE